MRASERGFAYILGHFDPHHMIILGPLAPQGPSQGPTDPPRALPGSPPEIRGAVEGRMKVQVHMKVYIYRWQW